MSTPAELNPLAQRARAYGCTQLVMLDVSACRPDQLEYLDLLPGEGARSRLTPVAAVAEHQGTALLYLVDGGVGGGGGGDGIDRSELCSLQRALANRSDPAWLGVVRRGSLDIYPIGFDVKPVPALMTVNEADTLAPLFFQSLVHSTLDVNHSPEGVDSVYQRIYTLLTKTVEAFPPHQSLQPLQVLSLAGRALFFRFLMDRSIVLPEDLSDICPAANELKDAFSDPTRAAMTSAWLDRTFNGDLLRLIDESIPAHNREARQQAYVNLYRSFVSHDRGNIFRHLEAILRGWKQVDPQQFQTTFDWGDLDFAHIPIGVLSQVYESFSHRVDPQTAKTDSVHYTPRTLARLMVDETFAAVPNPADARVLDPACGAGIFLALSFRRLIQERWLRDKKRPTTAIIREILYQQIRGFDVSEPALRLAALTLYFTAIEVDGALRPPGSLRFARALRDEVLFHFGENAADSVPASSSTSSGIFQLGSLRDEVATRFKGQFDIVLGNPPWTRLREEKPVRAKDDVATVKPKKGSKSTTDVLNSKFTEIGREALRERGLDTLSERYENPDKDTDLPFFWRATLWAKKDGLIALALHARVFQRTTGVGAIVWHSILRAVSVTGLINGADLRWTKVWEDVKVPFCLLFARNTLARPDHRFRFVALVSEPNVNRYGRFRIDYEASRPVSIALVDNAPWILKTLSLGTWLDVELMQQIKATFPRSLGEIWKAWDPKKVRTGEGYHDSPNQKQNPADFLADLEDFERPSEAFIIPHDELKTFYEKYGKNTAHRPRRQALFLPPLVIIPEAPMPNPTAARAFRSLIRPLAFSKSFYGYSCAEHPEKETLSALLYLLPQSILFAWFSLMISRRIGADRQTFIKEELDAIPFPDVTTLDAATRERIRRLAEDFEQNPQATRPRVDAFLFELYGLDASAVKVAEDTLFSAASYRKQGSGAFDPPSLAERTPFRVELGAFLEPFFDICGEHVAVENAAVPPDLRGAWAFVTVSRRGETVSVDQSLLRQAMTAADQRSASRIVVRAPQRQGLLIGILNQRRWWTQTRARLIGQYILKSHLDAFGLGEEV